MQRQFHHREHRGHREEAERAYIISGLGLIALFCIFSTQLLGNESQVNQDKKENEQSERVKTLLRKPPPIFTDLSVKNFRKLDGLKSENTVRKNNRHNPKQTDEFKTFKYDGLVVYGFVEKGMLRLIDVSITSSKWVVHHGMTVGMSIQSLGKLLGEPTSYKNNIYEYCDESDCVEFHRQGEIISKIRFVYYAD